MSTVNTPKPSALDKTEATAPEAEDAEYIEHRVNFIDQDGVQQTKTHRVLKSEWPAYEKEHGF